MAKKVNIPKDNNIISIPLEEAMPDNYLPYAVEVARERALPDVRDGLKPVHRRIMYGAYLLKAFPDKPYFKSARIVGDILGKFHPHGDASVYDAMTILAQNFTTRYPLIDGHGNWGSIDGDGAAAMRYTEARLAPIAMEMIRDIEKDVVEMVPNYSDSEMEPKVLPARYPNLLVNGAFGIAVGLATNIPPHNLQEVVDGVIAYMDNGEITTKELMQHIKGPDLPTGGVIIGKNSLLSAYETGEGKVTLRAKAKVEELENGRLGIVITEFPYRRNKAKLLQNISEMTGDKRHSKALESVIDIRDESDRTGIRAVIEFRKSTDKETAEKVLKYLYKRTDLQCNVSFNMVALADGKPQTLGLKSIIMHYVNHQKDVIIRRTKKELQEAEKRFHIVEGFIKAIDIMDEIIAEIRASKSKKDASDNLVSKFNFTEIQAAAILELMLYRLTGLEIKVFEKEYKELQKLITKLQKILKDEKELTKVIKSELLDVTSKFKDSRRTEIIEDESEAKIDIEELVVVEDIVITLSNEGFIKRVPLKTYNRSNSEPDAIEYREGDYARFIFQSNTRDSLMLFTNKGNMYQIKGNMVPEYKWKDKGEKVDTLIRGLELDQEKVVAAYPISNIHSPHNFIFITSKGNIKKTALDKFETNYTKLSAIRLKDDEELIKAVMVESEREEQFLSITTKNSLEFTIEEPVIEATDRNIVPTNIIMLPAKDYIINVEFTNEYKFATFTLGINKKGNIRIYERNKKDEYMKLSVSSNDNILVFTDSGTAYNLPAGMFQNLENKDISLSDITDNFDSSKETVLNILKCDNYNNDTSIFFFTKSGLVKKTMFKDFQGNYSEIQSYKFKNEEDRLVAIEFGASEKAELIMVTAKGMAIKFLSTNVNPMGRVASGVMGISLKEEDYVVFGAAINKLIPETGASKDEIAITSTRCSEITLTTSSKESKTLSIEDIKIQNRAGRGNNAFLVVMNDYIKNVKIK